MARELKNTVFSELGIVPDLTQEQRQDEAEMALLADKRNEELNEDDVAKNLIWKVVGRRGEKRIVKVTARDGDRISTDRGGRGGGRLPPSRAGGRGQPWRLPRVGRGGPVGRGGISMRGSLAERSNLLDLVRNGAEPRPRINSKRNREDREGEGEEEEEEERIAPVAPAERGTMAR